MKKQHIVIIAILLLPLVFYLVNPLGSSSLDPRARFMSVIPFHIGSSDMKPTLSSGDYILVDTAAYRESPPKRRDIIAFENPFFADQGDYVKRVIGIAGDRVQLHKGKLTINGTVVLEPYVSAANNIRTISNTSASWKVPSNKLFVLGDNRDNSNDSRFWGFVHVRKVTGKIIYTYKQ